MKKISLGMIEAGVSAMARIQRVKQGDAAVVATVYNAMEAVRLNEERTELKGPQPAKPYIHQDWPQWRFGPDGHGEIFNSPEEVPEGWTSVAEQAPPPPRRGRPPKHAE